MTERPIQFTLKEWNDLKAENDRLNEEHEIDELIIHLLGADNEDLEEANTFVHNKYLYEQKENEVLRKAIEEAIKQLHEAAINNGFPTDVIIASNTLKKALAGKEGE